MIEDIPNGSIMKILVADDEKSIRTGLIHLFCSKFTRIRVIEAADGIAAFQAVQEHPDLKLAFIDIRMPGMNGLELCDKIIAAGHKFKIVIVSGFSDFVYARTAIRLGVSDYLLKPINPSDALRIISDCLLENNPCVVEECKETEDSFRKIVEKMRSWIHDHLDKEITLVEIADLFHYSPNYLSVLFKKETGKGFQDYITACRMQRAAHLVLDPTLRMYEIGLRVGYTNAKAFSIAFRNYFDKTPTEYREGINISGS